MHGSPTRGLVGAVLITAVTGACAGRWHAAQPAPIADTSVRLHDHSLTIHLSAGRQHTSPLILYATGDAGWWGKDKDIFKRISPWGYPAAGFSAREYVHHLGSSTDVVLRGELAADYAAIIGAAETALDLPAATRVVFIGKSRGAGLAVAAAGHPRIRETLQGVLAIGLTREEEYVQHRSPGPRWAGGFVMLQTYDALPQLGAVPIVVIQSTRDQYVPAAEARTLFGPDTPVRQLHAIDAADHNFGGALSVLYQEMTDSFEWLISR
jgi:fermentation-respiration switch protein FrsA (DUF1100 family)